MKAWIYKYKRIINQVFQKQCYNLQYQSKLNGLSTEQLQQIQQNQKLSQNIEKIASQIVLDYDKQKSSLCFLLAQNEKIEVYQEFIFKYINENKIVNQQQLSNAMKSVYEQIKQNGTMDQSQFEIDCGIKFKFTEQQIEDHIKDYVKINVEMIKNANSNDLTQQLKIIRQNLVGSDQKLVFTIFNKIVKDVQKESQNQLKFQSKQNHIWDKFETMKARNLLISQNDEQIFQEHQKRNNGKTKFRFPPEPNGYLHIGHAKSMRLNFHGSKQLNGVCNLRFDDSNPETETQDAIDSILNSVEYLGYTADQVLYASNYFDKVYEYAQQLIIQGQAYICEQNQEDMQKDRKLKQPSPYRERDAQSSLRIFQEMKNKQHSEKSYCLRLKIQYDHVNPTMRDPVIYRIKYKQHPKTYDKWCIYPTYDFIHCISDSLEDIDYSLCTLEFEIRRELYYWILDALKLYKPFVWEYSRLNISRNLLSKRKLKFLIDNKVVDGWDDPRLLTLEALKVKGYPKDAINNFCDLVNVTRRGNENIISIDLLEHCCRQELQKISKKTMGVLNPVQIELINKDDRFFHEIQTQEGQTLKLFKTFFVDKDDIILDDAKENVFGIKEGAQVGLKYAGVIYINKIQNVNNNIKIFAEYHENVSFSERKSLVQTNVHWITEIDSRQCQITLYDNIFNVDNPQEFENLLEIVNPNSKQIYGNAMIPKNLQLDQIYQFERLGYFKFQNNENMNRIVQLYDKQKQKART